MFEQVCSDGASGGKERSKEGRKVVKRRGMDEGYSERMTGDKPRGRCKSCLDEAAVFEEER